MEALMYNIELKEKIERLQDEISQKKQELYQLIKSIPQTKIKNYFFKSKEGGTVSLAELFRDKNELIIVHNMGHKCPYCTMWADGFNGVTDHISNRASFVVESPDELSVMNRFAESRHWGFNMVSSCGNSFKKELGFETEDGLLIPGVSTFRKDEKGDIYLNGSTTFGPGDDFCSVWYFFDMLSNKDDEWSPKFGYLSL